MFIAALETSDLDVRVRFVGELPGLLGLRDLEIALPRTATVGDLLDCLTDKFGEDFTSRIFTAPGMLRHTMLIFVDGENIDELDGLGTQLGNGAIEVIMLPMFGGG